MSVSHIWGDGLDICSGSAKHRTPLAAEGWQPKELARRGEAGVPLASWSHGLRFGAFS